MEPGDRELVERIGGGDHEAFTLLYQRHRGRLYRHAYVQTGGRAEVAEEIVQDLFLSLFSGKARPRENVAGFLLVSVRNRALNACQRREARADQVPLEHAPAPAAPAQETPEAAVHRAEEADLLSDALLELPPEQREVVLLRAYEGLPWKEVAELTGVPLPTASTRYRAALERLRAACRSLSHA